MSEEKKKAVYHTRVKIVRQIVDVDAGSKSKGDSFHKVSQSVSTKLGSPYAFLAAITLVVLWAATGPFFNYSDTWQLAINTTTTIVTFLMVFAIQNTQNRDSKAMQLKLNELIQSSSSARSEFVDIEDLTDSELESLHGQFKELHEKIQSKTKS
jgi:low affinity Fe/Cu permease